MQLNSSDHNHDGKSLRWYWARLLPPARSRAPGLIVSDKEFLGGVELEQLHWHGSIASSCRRNRESESVDPSNQTQTPSSSRTFHSRKRVRSSPSQTKLNISLQDFWRSANMTSISCSTHIWQVRDNSSRTVRVNRHKSSTKEYGKSASFSSFTVILYFSYEMEQVNSYCNTVPVLWNWNEVMLRCHGI